MSARASSPHAECLDKSFRRPECWGGRSDPAQEVAPKEKIWSWSSVVNDVYVGVYVACEMVARTKVAKEGRGEGKEGIRHHRLLNWSANQYGKRSLSM